MPKKKSSRLSAVAKKAKKNKNQGAQPPIWSWDDGLTQSALNKFIDCPEQFALSYIDGLTPKGSKESFEFGSIIHHCLEFQYEVGRSPQEVAQAVCSQYVNLARKKLRTTTEKEKVEELAMTAQMLFPHYCQYWEEDDQNLQWVAREEKFAVPYTISMPQGGTRAIILRGMRDGLYRTSSGSLGVFETKTKSRISEKDILDSLRSDLQTNFYALATKLERGETPTQVLYNVIRRPGIYRRKGEDIHDWLQRVEQDVRKQPDHYFKRWIIHIDGIDLRNFQMQTLDPYLRLFVEWYDRVEIKKKPGRADRLQSPYHRVNCNALFGKYGRSEMYDAIHGRMFSYTTRSTPFPELSMSPLVLPNNKQTSGTKKKEAVCLPSVK